MLRIGSRSVLLLCALVALPSAGFAGFGDGEGVENVVFTPSLQYRLRFYHEEGKDFAKGNVNNFYRARARVGLAGLWNEVVGAFLQVQDVRTFGEESNTLNDFSADGLDLHQGYLRIMPTQAIEIRAGRQEVIFENHRLIGNVGWTERARSFDALRLLYKRKALRLDLFYAKIREEGTGMTPAKYDKDLIALDTNYALGPELKAAFIGIGDFDAENSQKRFTVGVLLKGALGGGLSYSAEGYYQFGSADNDVTYAAYLAAAHLRYTLGGKVKPFIEVFGEMLSGDDDPGDADRKTFNTLFATNHKFYGEMDFFTDIPKHTGERGLLDVGGVIGLQPSRDFKTKLTVHHFRGAADRGSESTVFGTEADLRIDYRVLDHLHLDLVYGVFLPGDLLKAGRDDTRAEHRVFVTSNVWF